MDRWKEEKKSDKSIGTYLDAYKEFLLSRDKNSISIPEPDIDIEKVRKSFKKPDLYQLDGMDGLISKLGVDDLVKLAIETSLFFHKDIVQERFEAMYKKKELPARKSTDEEKKRNEKDGEHSYDKTKKKWKYQDKKVNPSDMNPES